MLENNSSEEGREAMARTKATEELKKIGAQNGKIKFLSICPWSGWNVVVIVGTGCWNSNAAESFSVVP